MIRFLVALAFSMCAITSAAHGQGMGNFSGADKTSPTLLQQLCERGDAEACGDLGVRHAKGDGVPKDAKRAAALWLRGCEGGDGFSCRKLGFAHMDGEGVAKDPKQAAAFFQRGCDGKDGSACAELSLNYNDGIGVPQDDAKVALYADRGCDYGSYLGCYLLGVVFEQGAQGYPRSIDRSVAAYRDSCDGGKGLGKACEKLDQLGYSQTASSAAVRPAPQSAAPQPAAASPPTSSAADQSALGRIAFAAGQTAYNSKDYATAIGHFARACDSGNMGGCAALGEMYVKGEGVAANGARAAGPLAKACDAGNMKACGNLGGLYERGVSVTANKALAFRLYGKACSASDQEGCHNLGRLHQTGEGTGSGKNYALAAQLFQTACSAGHAGACLDLGWMYSNGQHFQQDQSQAERWFKLGCDKGLSRSCDALTASRAETEREAVIAQQNRDYAEMEQRWAENARKAEAAKGPFDCLKLPTKEYFTSEPDTYTSCSDGECNSYERWEPLMFRRGVRVSTKIENQCSRAIEVHVRYDSVNDAETERRWYGANAFIPQKDHFITVAGNDISFLAYADYKYVSARWAMEKGKASYPEASMCSLKYATTGPCK